MRYDEDERVANKTILHSKEGKNNTLHKEESLIEYLYHRLSENGYTDISITNIRVFADGNIMTDVAYTWQLNAWRHRAEHKDSIFVYADNKWHSPIFI